MKKVTFILLALISGTAFGQNDIDVAVSADIVSPIVVAQITAMNFGKVSNNATGTVVLDTSDGYTGLTQVGVTSPTSGVFSVTAADSYTYVVTLSSSIELLNTADNTKKMTVDNFTTSPDVTTATLTGTGVAEDYMVGATLNVTSGQTTGSYTGTFNVTANYN